MITYRRRFRISSKNLHLIGSNVRGIWRLHWILNRRTPQTPDTPPGWRPASRNDSCCTSSRDKADCFFESRPKMTKKNCSSKKNSKFEVVGIKLKLLRMHPACSCRTSRLHLTCSQKAQPESPKMLRTFFSFYSYGKKDIFQIFKPRFGSERKPRDF